MGYDAGFISTKKAAEILNVHPESVRRYGQQGLLLITRKGGRGWRQVWEESVRDLAHIHTLPDGSPERAAALQALIRKNRGEPDPE
jgi:DNA-binding transcriptional MerR regulator